MVMIVRMVATFQYVDHVGCACSTSVVGAWSDASAESGTVACVSIVPPLLDKVDESEDRDPDDVDEVPVQRADVDEQRIPRAEAASVVDCQHRHQPQHTGGNVGAVKSGQGEESRTEKVSPDGQTFVHERS